MKKFLSKIKNRIKNSGSSLVLVIVALGFVGILAGALLTAVGYAYRLKLYDYNAKSNFFYLEQAMDEIYAGVGAQTMTAMQEAYEETREKVVEYDMSQGVYKNIDNTLANTMFKDTFMTKFNPSVSSPTDFFYLHDTPEADDSLVKNLSNMISNSTISLDYSNLRLEKQMDGTLVTKIIIKNVKLVRKADYNRSPAKGTFKQTISTDIEISRPDFDVSFDSVMVDTDNLFDYCLIADSGVEVNEQPGSTLNINGNVYAASDFYNKVYNNYDNENKLTTSQKTHVSNISSITKSYTPVGSTESIDTQYNLNKVSNYAYTSSAHTLFNHYNFLNASIIAEGTNFGDIDANVKTSNEYDGYNLRSKYSGFYINGSNVNFVGEYFVVPGSLSVMNAGSLNVFGYKDSDIIPANVWADEVVLGGTTRTNSNNKQYGSKASFDGNLYVKDDTQIEGDYCEFTLSGGYYGYSNSSTSDDRVFVPTTKKVVNDASNLNIYQEFVGGKVQNRGHYNSSSIIVNGQNAKLDFTNTNLIYIAGRSYVELSSQNKGDRNVIYTDIKDSEGNNIFFTTGDYEYNQNTEDYKTGESLSIKSNQIAYIPYNAPDRSNPTKYVLLNDQSSNSYDYMDPSGYKYNESTTVSVDDADRLIYQCEVPTELQNNLYLFKKYFGCEYNSSGDMSFKSTFTIPVTLKEVTVTGSNSARVMYYIDFGYVLSKKTYNEDAITFKNGENKVDALSRSFIKDYFDYLDYYEDYNSGTGGATLQNYIKNKTDVDLYSHTADFYKDDLNNVIKYKYYDAGQIALHEKSYDNVGTVNNNYTSYTSGVMTKSGNSIVTSDNNDDIKFDVVLSKNSNLATPLLGSTENTSTAVKALDYSKDFQKHYNYVKWALQDLDSTEVGDPSVIDTDVDVIDKIISSTNKDVGEASITPLNKFLNFNYIYNTTEGDPWILDSSNNELPTRFGPDDFDLGSYRVWVSDGDVTVEAADDANNEVTGIVIAKGDVFFKNDSTSKSVHKFNGIVISGGKIFINNNLTTNINSSELCRNIINACIVKSKEFKSSNTDAKKQAAYACRVLSLFKAYEGYANDVVNGEYHEPDTSARDINTIDYSDVVRYNNWKRNVD